MIIFSHKNTIITTDKDYFISNGNAVKLIEPEFICANFAFDAFSESAIITSNGVIKTSGIYSVDYLGESALAIGCRRIYPNFTLLAQHKDYDLTVTVYGDYTLKVTIEFIKTTKIFTLPFYSEKVEIITRYVAGTRIIALHFSDINKTQLYAYLNDEIVSFDTINGEEISFTDNLISSKTHATILRHKTITTYKFEKTSLKEIDKKVYPANSDLYSIKPDLLGVAFLEEVYVGGNYSNFLCPALKEKAPLIPNYFGKIEKVIPINNSATNCAIAYKSSNNYDYVVKAVDISVEDGKITNFKILD